MPGLLLLLIQFNSKIRPKPLINLIQESNLWNNTHNILVIRRTLARRQPSPIHCIKSFVYSLNKKKKKKEMSYTLKWNMAVSTLRVL